MSEDPRPERDSFGVIDVPQIGLGVPAVPALLPDFFRAALADRGWLIEPAARARRLCRAGKAIQEGVVSTQNMSRIVGTASAARGDGHSYATLFRAVLLASTLVFTLASGTVRTQLSAQETPRIGSTGDTARGHKAPTFYKDVLPIAQEHCQSCHRPGQVGPFSMLDYQSARPWAKAIKLAVATRRMPPWLANPEYGHFINDRSMTQADIGTLAAWVDAGAPAGDPRDTPSPVRWPDGGWTIPPDVTVDLPAFPVPATGVLEWEQLVVPSPFTEDTWVTSAELLPGAPAVIHHISFQFQKHDPATPYNVYEWVAVPHDDARAEIHHGTTHPAERTVFTRAVGSTEVTQRHGQPLIAHLMAGQFIYLPGGGPDDYRPRHAGVFVPAGSDIVLSLHYTTNGAATVDRSRIGFTVAKAPPAKKVVSQNSGTEADLPIHVIRADFSKLAIPPYDEDYRAPLLEYFFKSDTYLLSAQPHAHVRGKSVRYTLIYPDGRQEIILDVPHYDFNWQIRYTIARQIPRGSRMRVQFVYDNSAGNRYNPDPSQWVYFGMQSWEEMQGPIMVFLMDRHENEEGVLREHER